MNKTVDDVLLSWNDPAEAGLVWNVYRDTVPDPSTWGPPLDSGVADADAGTAGIQYVDIGAIAAGPLLHYLITADNGCIESPLQ